MLGETFQSINFSLLFIMVLVSVDTLLSFDGLKGLRVNALV